VLYSQSFSIRVSSREAYVGPTRGAQGNALKTIVAMPFVLDGALGETVIEAMGVAHRIRFTVDPIRQEPRISHEVSTASVRNGTAVRVRRPESACSILIAARQRFLQILGDFRWLNVVNRNRWTSGAKLHHATQGAQIARPVVDKFAVLFESCVISSATSSLQLVNT